MNGLPVTATATISPASARSRRRPIVSVRPAIDGGPNVLGLVWSKPLSSVMRASVPAPPGSATSCTRLCVTTSVAKSAAVVAFSVVVELEETDVLDGEAGLGKGLLRGRHRADSHDLGLDADERERHQAHPHRQS